MFLCSCSCKNFTPEENKSTYDGNHLICKLCNRYRYNDSPDRLRYHLSNWLVKLGHNKRYLEAGATDGISQSNTYHLNNYGWYGILVEPDPEIFKILQKNRPKDRLYNNFLVSDLNNKSTSKLYHNENKCPLMSTFVSNQSNPIIVNNITLNTILEHEKIDFLCLDVEGYEFEALEGLDLNKHKPTIVCVEMNNKLEEIHNKFLNCGYVLAEKVAHNNIYVIDSLIKECS